MPEWWTSRMVDLPSSLCQTSLYKSDLRRHPANRSHVGTYRRMEALYHCLQSIAIRPASDARQFEDSTIVARLNFLLQE